MGSAWCLINEWRQAPVGRLRFGLAYDQSAWLRALCLLALISCAGCLASCASRRPAKVPMDTLFDPAAGSASTQRAQALVVMLPGAYDTPADFVREGFVAAVRERQLAVDLQMVDAHVRYYTDQSILTRLKQDVIEPAKQRGYRQIWLVGISIGGMGALMYSATYPEDISGVVALAPYLGPRNISVAVERAGGLRYWPREGFAPPDDAIDRHLWLWLKARADATPAELSPPLYWGYGESDRFAHGHKVVGQSLPPQCVFTVQGGHDWPSWIALWRRMLDVLPLPSTGQRVQQAGAACGGGPASAAVALPAS
jgi:pimeloyl-ACP methyl ester carboxylesterase